jgi:regulatory protein
MLTITAIEKQKRRPRGDVYVDGVLALTLRLDLIVTSGLAVGSEFTGRMRRELEAEDQRLEAINQALRLLSLVPRSEKELRDRLRRRAYRPIAIDAAIDRMRDLGYLNDVVFARGFVEARQSATPRSKRALAFELTRKGVDRETASEAVAELSDADAAYDAAQRRLRALRGLDRQAFTRRLGSFLASRGFGYGVARATIDRCYQEIQALEEEAAAGRA